MHFSSELARDPQKAMRDLEIKLGAKPGELLEKMLALGDGTNDWTKHLPWHAKVNYYANPQLREKYGEHLSRCTLCQAVLETIHPSPAAAIAFAEAAARSSARRAMIRKAVFATSALGIAALAVGAWWAL